MKVNQPALYSLLKQIAAAPHRLMFFIGAFQVIAAMAWWTAWLLATRWQLWSMPQPAVWAGWMHAIVMQYQMLPPFMFGFLLTVFPRWMGLPSVPRSTYVMVGACLFGGEVLTLIGLFSHALVLDAGIWLTLLGWCIGVSVLWRLISRESGRTWHAISCASALTLGLCGLALFAIYLLVPQQPVLAFIAIKFGGFGLLLPIFFTVCHRMVPFFAAAVVPGYKSWRPMWLLGAFWVLVLTHLALELVHGYAWLWMSDLPMAALTGFMAWKWWPRTRVTPPLVRVLLIGFAWMPIAFVLYAGQSLWYAYSGVYAFDRGPAHALFVGFFGSLMVAMVTRVTQGHSGRPLQLGVIPAITFVALQLVAVVRVAADLMPDKMAWQAVAAIGWLLAFLPWVLRSAWIYLTPRSDGKPG